MKGQGAHLDKQIKMKIYQARALEYNKQYDALEDDGHNPEQIPDILSQKAFTIRHSKDEQGQLPFEKFDKVLPIAGSTHLGFEKAHLTISATKQMMEHAESRMKQSKLIKSQGGKLPEEDVFQQQRENEQRMKERIQYDHIKDLHQMKHTDPKLKSSNYQQNFQFTKYMLDECDNQNFDHHQKKNDLKQYQEAYIICKKTLRK